MAIPLKVKWIDKTGQTDLHERIRHIGGDSGQLQWKHTQAQAVESIERGDFAYYLEKNNRALRLDVGQTPEGSKYLKIEADLEPFQVLSDLPQMPQPIVSV